MLEKSRENTLSENTYNEVGCSNYLSRKDDLHLLYKNIIDGGQFCFCTISPKPDKMADYEDIQRTWFMEFGQLLDITDKILIVAELNKKGQLHYHMMIRLWPLRNKYTFIKKFVSRWFHMAIIEPIYGHEPREGFKYLFKQHDEVEGVIEECPTYTKDEIKGRYSKTIKSKFYQVASEDSLDGLGESGGRCR